MCGFSFSSAHLSGGAKKSRERKLALNFAHVGCCSNYTKYGLRGTTVRGLFLLRPRQVGGDRGGRRRGLHFLTFFAIGHPPSRSLSPIWENGVGSIFQKTATSWPREGSPSRIASSTHESSGEASPPPPSSTIHPLDHPP